MKISKLVLNNVGLYYGKTEFDLSPSLSKESTKNIILFGGLNGAGKTTLFDSINLCLYGKEMFPRLSMAGYHDYLRSKIHHAKSLLVNPDCASVGLEFEYSQFGDVNRYFIERRWEVVGKKVLESVLIKKNEEVLKEVRQESWQDFIKQMIPPGLSQLFFFDGEKIQKMMEDNNGAEFKSSVKMLLGLDIIERLQADLKIYKTRNIKNASDDKYRKELEALNEEKTTIEKQRAEKQTHLAGLENVILKIDDDISKYRAKIAAQGNDFLERKDSLAQDGRSVAKDLSVTMDKLRELAGGLLPLSIATSCLIKMKQQIEVEKKHSETRIAKEKLKEEKGDLIAKINSSEFLVNMEPVLRERLTIALEKELDALFVPQENVKEIFGFSSTQTERLLLSIEQAIVDVPKSLRSLSSEYETKFRNLENITNDLKKVPDEEFVKPMYEKLNELNRNLGALLNEKSHLEMEVAVFSREIAEIERKIDKVTSHIERNQKETVKLKLAKKAEKALTLYKHKLAQRKVESFKNEFLSLFTQLHRKKDLLEHVELNPVTFDINLYDKMGKIISSDSLSAGEKEIYAISLLTALARTSGQNLPFIIDMPLGRMDSLHRDHIVKRFLPYASHQVIIFSTNTEIEKDYYEVLKPNLSRVYNLCYINETGRTIKEEGYFWK